MTPFDDLAPPQLAADAFPTADDLYADAFADEYLLNDIGLALRLQRTDAGLPDA